MLLVMVSAAPGFAQNPASVVDSLVVEFWPDYDRPSVLVLLTGMLPGETQLPAAVTLPLPQGAQINAVARIDSRDENMVADIAWRTESADTLTLITPELRFRVEYYLPYTVDNRQHSFDFTWLAAIAVNRFQLRVQRPLSAAALSIEPAGTNIVSSGDGFEYYRFPDQAVAAGQPFSLHVSYKMDGSRLSVASIPPPNAGTQPAALPAAPGTDFSWALVVIIAGGVTIFGALVWQIVSRRRAPGSRSSNDLRDEARSRTRFCLDCGGPVDEGDRFCRRCGSEL